MKRIARLFADPKYAEAVRILAAGKEYRTYGVELTVINNALVDMEKRIATLEIALTEANKDVARVDFIAANPRDATVILDGGERRTAIAWGFASHDNVTFREACDLIISKSPKRKT